MNATRWVVGLVVAVAAVAVGVHAWPGAAEALQYDRGAIRAGQVWRLWTGHLTHWSWDHLVWDVLALVVAGVWAARLHPRTTAAVLLLGPMAISAGLWVGQPGMETYRGLSGVDTGLFAVVAAGVAWAAWRDRSWGWLAAMVVASLLFIGKLIDEWATGTTLFATSAGVFNPVPLAHLLGAGVGLAAVGIAGNRPNIFGRAITSRGATTRAAS